MPFDPSTAKLTDSKSSFDPSTAKPFELPGQETFFSRATSPLGTNVQRATGELPLDVVANRVTVSNPSPNIDQPSVVNQRAQLEQQLKAKGIDPRTNAQWQDLVRKQGESQRHVVETGANMIPGTVGGIAKVAPKALSAVRMLMNEGVKLTPGQMLGGAIKTAEEATRSLPITGDAISAAYKRSIQDFNKAAYNRALAPIGQKFSGKDVGTEGIKEVEKKISAAYKDIVPKMRVKLDAEFANDMGTLGQSVSELPPDIKKTFQKILENRVFKRLKNGEMDGQTFKQVESELSQKAGNYRSSPDAAQREMARALDDLNGALRDNAERASPPEIAQQLKSANTAWANFVRLRAAAVNRATSGSVFTPGDLLAGIKKTDKSAYKGAFARGDALMQDLAEAGQEVLPAKLPESGTIRRGIMAGGTIMGAQALSHPEVIFGLGAGALPYTRPATTGLNFAVKELPKLRQEQLDQAITRVLSGMQ